MQKLEMERDAEQSEVLELLEQRTTVQQWLARLDEQRGTVSDHVLDRVRTDYESRLKETLDVLAMHRTTLREQLDGVAIDLDAAEVRHREAVDQLEEVRLRNLIGEIDDETWTTRRGELEEAVRSAEQNEIAARNESERLQNLLDQLEGREPRQTSRDISAPLFDLHDTNGADGNQDGHDDDPDDADFADVEDVGLSPADTLVTPPHGDVFDEEFQESSEEFLGKIDRAIAEDAIEPADEHAASDQDATDTAPKPGLKCAECGYTNDLSAWFCGVCGADVG